MDRLSKPSLAQQVEATLEAAIRSGELGPELPGYRELETVLGVSRRAIRPALASLVRRGVLIQPGPKRRFQVSNAAPSESKHPKTLKVLMLEPSRFGQRLSFSSEIAANLASRSAAENWAIDHVCVKTNQSRANPKRWQRLLEASGADAMIVVAGTRKTLDWACDCGVPVLALGGDAAGLSIPEVGYDTNAMITIALERLLASGHRDVCLPLAVQSPNYVQEVETAVREAFHRHGATFHPKLHFPQWHSNIPEAWRDGLRWRFGVKTPDALILMHVSSYQFCSGFLMELGMKVPDDISLVALAEDTEMTWFHPRPACFDLAPLRLADKIAGWIKAPDHARSSLVLPPKWVEGESIRARNASEK